MSQDLRNRHGVDFAPGVIAFFYQLFEVATGNLDSKLVGNHFAGALLLLEPRSAGQGDPHGFPVHVETYIHRVGVTRGYCHNVGLPRAVQVFPAPAVGHMEIFVHAISLSFLRCGGKRPGHDWWRCSFPAGKLVRLQWLCPHLYGPACKLIEAKDKHLVDTQTRHALKGDKFAQATKTSVNWVSGHRSNVLR